MQHLPTKYTYSKISQCNFYLNLPYKRMYKNRQNWTELQLLEDYFVFYEHRCGMLLTI